VGSPLPEMEVLFHLYRFYPKRNICNEHHRCWKWLFVNEILEKFK
jgi:hypothetical protein